MIMRVCNECKVARMCTKRNNQVNGNKEIEAVSKLLKRQAPNEFGHMLPYFKE